MDEPRIEEAGTVKVVTALGLVLVELGTFVLLTETSAKLSAATEMVASPGGSQT